MVKNPPANAAVTRDMDLISGSGRFLGGGHGNPLQYSCLENSHGQRSLVGHSPWGHTEPAMTQQLTQSLSPALRVWCPPWLPSAFYSRGPLFLPLISVCLCDKETYGIRCSSRCWVQTPGWTMPRHEGPFSLEKKASLVPHHLFPNDSWLAGVTASWPVFPNWENSLHNRSLLKEENE